MHEVMGAITRLDKGISSILRALVRPDAAIAAAGNDNIAAHPEMDGSVTKR
ncbi:hypothetical protein HHA04nite_14270 [Halomonas halophila]|uniref:Uncharacterized protein n=1 Tax=Halomonas halophila TaxID=29573 RepID=A0ABQ0U569_9GAMM|nr:hypothetical protein HHA04nite_14270 [Halomonas halophila]